LQKIDPDYPCCCNACSGISWIWWVLFSWTRGGNS
jgi:hypothetical protein